MKRKNYSKALTQSRELVARLRNMGHSLDDFLLRCRENITKITVDEYERIVGQFRTLMVDEQRELQEIHKTALREAEAIKNALESGADTEEARKNLRELNEINKNLDLTITEQRSLINAKNLASDSYNQILRDSFAIKSFERMNFDQDIMVKLRRKGEGVDALTRDFTTKEELIKEFTKHCQDVTRDDIDKDDKTDDYSENFHMLAEDWLSKKEGEITSKRIDDRYGVVNKILLKFKADELFLEDEGGRIRPTKKAKDLMPYVLRKDRVQTINSWIEEENHASDK